MGIFFFFLSFVFIRHGQFTIHRRNRMRFYFIINLKFSIQSDKIIKLLLYCSSSSFSFLSFLSPQTHTLSFFFLTHTNIRIIFFSRQFGCILLSLQPAFLVLVFKLLQQSSKFLPRKAHFRFANYITWKPWKSVWQCTFSSSSVWGFGHVLLYISRFLLQHSITHIYIYIYREQHQSTNKNQSVEALWPCSS